MSTPTDDDNRLSFGAALLAARKAARVTRAELAKEMDLLPRTISRWETGQNVPDSTRRELVIHALYRTGRVPRALLEQLADAAYTRLWMLGIEARPAAPWVPTPAHAKIVDDAIRQAAEDLGIQARALRPAVSKLLGALARGGIPAGAAAELALAGIK
jgi:transcriptional regulator with XRE-family HTH domain